MNIETSTVGNTFCRRALIYGEASRKGPSIEIRFDSESIDVRVKMAKMGNNQNIVNALKIECS